MNQTWILPLRSFLSSGEKVPNTEQRQFQGSWDFRREKRCSLDIEVRPEEVPFELDLGRG
jgi:hypothetical protein